MTGVAIAIGAGVPAVTTGNNLTLSLGGVIFQSFEIPEQLDQLGGEQIAAFHDFPGGTRSEQTYGAFPEPMSWKGILTGQNALTRAQVIDRIRVAANPVVLAYERFSYLGIVTRFLPRPKGQWLVPYEIHFYPIQDLSGGNTPPLNVNTAEIQLLAQVALLSDLYLGENANLLALPAVLNAPVGNLLTTVNVSLGASAGIVANISATNITSIDAACAAVIAAAAALIEGTDPSQSSPALDASNYAASIQLIVNSTDSPRWQIVTINPDLSQLAAKYLGDASRWREIASLNGLYDPQPIGQFTLNIPPPSGTN